MLLVWLNMNKWHRFAFGSNDVPVSRAMMFCFQACLGVLEGMAGSSCRNNP